MTHTNTAKSKSIQEIEQQLFSQPLSALTIKLSYFRRLERVWQVIEKEYSNPRLSLERIAKLGGISKNHLNVCMRQSTGLTFYQLLIRYRLLQAIGMMKAHNYSLAEIATGNGFGSLNAFERNFRRFIGVTPGEFKGDRDFW
jgi:AraC-like DNA-binding protein